MRISPFACVRPAPELCDRVAALPYDVVTPNEARAEVAREPLSFLGIDCPEVHMSQEGNPDTAAYQAVADLYAARRADGTFVQDSTPTFSLYRLEWLGRQQTGIVACCEVDDYLNGTIKRHERVFEDKLAGRVAHIEALNAHTGPIFLTYRDVTAIDALVERATAGAPLCDFTDAHGVRQLAWRISDSDLARELQQAFAQVPAAYIADGHHRTGAAVRVAERKRAAHPEAPASAEWNRFMAVLFPASQLSVFPYELGSAGVFEERDDVSIERIMEVSDEGGIMPQKSTWFEPKLRSGLFIHEL